MNIMVTDFCNDTDVCIFTENQKIDIEYVRNRIENANQEYSDIFEVKDDDLQYHVYEPYWIK